MTTWTDLQAHVHSTYEIADDQPGYMKLIFETEHLRSQVVVLALETLLDGAEEWCTIQSPIGDIADLDLLAVLRASEDMLVGGLGLIGDLVVVKHSVPLEDMNITEFERPLALVIYAADRLEAKFAGGDVH